MNIFEKFVERYCGTHAKYRELTGDSHHVTRRLAAQGPTQTERLAMSAIAAGLKPWSPENAYEADAVRPIVDVIRSALAPTEKENTDEKAA